jgi:hypothetical protein
MIPHARFVQIVRWFTFASCGFVGIFRILQIVSDFEGNSLARMRGILKLQLVGKKPKAIGYKT